MFLSSFLELFLLHVPACGWHSLMIITSRRVSEWGWIARTLIQHQVLRHLFQEDAQYGWPSIYIYYIIYVILITEVGHKINNTTTVSITVSWRTDQKDTEFWPKTNWFKVHSTLIGMVSIWKSCVDIPFKKTGLLINVWYVSGNTGCFDLGLGYFAQH